MRWIPAHDDAVLPEEVCGPVPAGFIQWCVCGFEIRSIRLVLPRCPRCGREGAHAWQKVIVRHRNYRDVLLVPDSEWREIVVPKRIGWWTRLRETMRLVRHPHHRDRLSGVPCGGNLLR